jgi:predicted NBD/HSP70 family sugar kinase
VQPGSSAIDVDRLVRVLEGSSASDRRLTQDLARAVAGALSSVTALFNPEAVVIGGPWGGAGGFSELVAAHLRDTAAVEAEVRAAHLGTRAPLTGARITAVRTAQQLLSRRRPQGVAE